MDSGAADGATASHGIRRKGQKPLLKTENQLPQAYKTELQLTDLMGRKGMSSSASAWYGRTRSGAEEDAKGKVMVIDECRAGKGTILTLIERDETKKRKRKKSTPTNPDGETSAI
jgi:hypothetical protein